MCVCACIVVRGSRRRVGNKSLSARLSVATVVYLVQVLSGSPLSSASLSSRSNKLRKSRIIKIHSGRQGGHDLTYLLLASISMLQNQTVDLTKERLLITVLRPEPRFEILRMRRLPVV